MKRLLIACGLALCLAPPLWAAPQATPKPSNENQQQDLLKSILLDIAPPPPNQDFEIPQPVLLTEPRSLLSNAVIVAPGTVKMQIEVKNKNKIAPIKAYVFQVIDLGLPMLDFDDKFLHQSSSPKETSLKYTFAKGGRYAVVASVVTQQGDVGSTRLSLFAR
ncbi:hypothetical protein COW36_11570 [bacterium (Candidatus Blackallbacteria) CG17_big_fil_post_rev_8_21_14_2_50_48_46]|uniref:CARDB domain-containing protein n=1 Tax=bacterium (Candidatus Blackallbacteria) CG17_big_fil_post_rev_8_21_14_2_50_48_46 TaxID=2014261 RepID=A0A2M7G4L6_9BACT|nr:MAG: hypothetical protein COW64_21790 [bacterium (Candidatus Blackallbacteria) CG18_big_fil_WC_8_21_14_2_50_49_26]PIW16776.1 MAG: hypothetical protein COW36_11570 [bacterium (Candidatus Blackallbacteria) CG17_big_fil_post_rev_8_21_14_2_50_48_46]PIW49568.1 MAG: hypothetical protein COW20_05490 [bacterium (Candidatus Blackallbacteria) CG13_big_fil_rev_8_21_14_2_50_49_14]